MYAKLRENFLLDPFIAFSFVLGQCFPIEH